MKTKKFLNSIICAVSAVSLTVCMADMPVKSAENELSETENQLIELINNERENEGLSPLEVVPYLNEVAQVRAEELKTDFSHYRPNGEYFDTVIDFDMFNYSLLYEDVFKSDDENAEETFEAWNNYPTQRNAFMNDEIEYIGVSVIYNEDGWYWQIMTGSLIDEDEEKLSDEMPDFSGRELSETENQLIELINNERENEGLKPLKIVPYLNEVAQARAWESCYDFSHYRPNGEYFDSIVDENIFNYYALYENLFKTDVLGAEYAFESWNNSAVHRKAMMNDEIEYIGVGLVDNPADEYEWHWQITLADTLGKYNEKNRLIDIINEARKKKDLKPLEVSDYLNEVAQARAEEITADFSHTRPDGTSYSTIINENTFNYSTVYERIFKSENELAEEAFDAWNSGEVPLDALYSEDSEYIGVGLVYDENSAEGWHWVLITGNEIKDDKQEIEEAKNQLIELINNEREKEGLIPLEVHPYLSEISAKRAEELKTYFSHTRPDGSFYNTLIDENIFSYEVVRENIMKADDASAEDAFEMWNSVSAHRKAMFSEDLRYIGVELLYDENSEEWYWELITASVYNEIPAGDANGDGECNSADAVMIMQALSNPDEYTIKEECLDSADIVNKGDGITSLDALAVQMIGVNLVNAEDLPITSVELNSRMK